MKHFGYWVFGKNMENVNIETFKKNGVTDIFLNYYAFATHGEKKVLSWIEKANKNNINIHIWMQCFYNGEWINPVISDLKPKIAEAKKYANLKGVKGVHLDYLRYPGNAYKTTGGTEAITNFVKEVRKECPNTFLSCAVMPETSAKKYYGQDFDALGKIVDAILPMQYKGNYKGGNDWLTSTTKMLVQKGKIWSGLQTYKSDNDATMLSEKELINDIKICLDNKANGVILFRYGISPNINFKKISSDNMVDYYTYNEIVTRAKNIKKSVEKEYKLGENPQWGYFISKAIVTPKKNITKFKINAAPESSGDKLDTQIIYKDYIDMAKRFIKYVETNKTLPNYITSNGKKVKVNDYVYMFARILVYYAENSAYPAYAVVKSDSFTKKNTLNSYMTEKGCSGMGQCTGYYCACNSLQQAFYRLTGIKVAESTIAKWAGTTSSGTSHNGINSAVAQFNKKYDKNIKITWKNFSDLGSTESERWKTLQNYINKGAVFCHLLYRNQYGHYEVPKSVGDSNLSILNSLGDKCNSPAYCGYIETRSKKTQLSYLNGISQKSIAILTK